MPEHIVVPDKQRVLGRAGKWNETRNDLREGKTIFVPEPDDFQARNALHQSFRMKPGWKLHRARRMVHGLMGTVFWLEHIK
jgi:hypothetical protein